MNSQAKGTAVVTGASSGIGAATARRLASEGFSVVLGARRTDATEKLAEECGGRALPLDVNDPGSVTRFCDEIEEAAVLVNNAGLARGLEPVAEMPDEHLQAMLETNVLGLVRTTRALLPKLAASGAGHVVNVGSIAGFETYPGGGGYTASKHAVRAITKTLRVELLGKPVRVTEVAPGHVATEFVSVRFEGEEESAAKTYEGFTPLSAEDIADCIAWAVTRPPNVNVDEIVVRSISQATATDIDRSN